MDVRWVAKCKESRKSGWSRMRETEREFVQRKIDYRTCSQRCGRTQGREQCSGGGESGRLVSPSGGRGVVRGDGGDSGRPN